MVVLSNRLGNAGFLYYAFTKLNSLPSNRNYFKSYPGMNSFVYFSKLFVNPNDKEYSVANKW